MLSLSAKDAKYGFGLGGRIMDQAILNMIGTFIRDIDADLGLRLHFTPGSRTPFADAKRSKSLRWR